MKIEVLHQKENELKFVAEEVDAVLLNTLRRIATTEVPTMAIERIDITENSSVIYDEILAHRLGLVPLTTDLKTYKLPEECKCKGEGCKICEVKLTISKKGPAVVYSGDLKSKDPKVKPFYDKIPLVKLAEGQELKVTATAVLGKGIEHTKWSTGLMTFQGYPDIKIGNVKNCEECAEVCPRRVFECKDGKLKVRNNEACNLCNVCVESCSEIQVNAVPDKFIVDFEGWGQLEPKEILLNAADVLNSKLKEFDKALK